MRLQLVIPHAVWPRATEAVEASIGLSLPAFSLLCGRGARTRFEPVHCLDWLAQAFGLPDFPAGPLTLAAENPVNRHGYWLRAASYNGTYRGPPTREGELIPESVS